MQWGLSDKKGPASGRYSYNWNSLTYTTAAVSWRGDSSEAAPTVQKATLQLLSPAPSAALFHSGTKSGHCGLILYPKCLV